ncbi:MAG: FkbM family methyltransferase [Bacteroidota bacterium]
MDLITKIKRRIGVVDTTHEKPKLSYSQCGEDLIIDFIFEQFKLPKISYLDIGAHHPTYINNTALFYKKGSVGVCIEPDPFLFKRIKKVRDRDVCLNVGIGVGKEREADFYIMSIPTLNTFSKEEAERYASYGDKRIARVIKMPIVPVNEIIQKHFNSSPDFISLDVEGLDFSILQSFDFERYRPKVWCIETLTYSENKTEEKIKETIDFMLSKNYFVYADTFINTIFVDNEAWTKR